MSVTVAALLLGALILWTVVELRHAPLESVMWDVVPSWHLAELAAYMLVLAVGGWLLMDLFALMPGVAAFGYAESLCLFSVSAALVWTFRQEEVTE